MLLKNFVIYFSDFLGESGKLFQLSHHYYLVNYKNHEIESSNFLITIILLFKVKLLFRYLSASSKQMFDILTS